MSQSARAVHVAALVPDVHSQPLPALIERLTEIAVRGLTQMYEPRTRCFPRTLRTRAGESPLVAEGMSVRYAAIAALGLSRLPEPTRRDVLAGHDVARARPRHPRAGPGRA